MNTVTLEKINRDPNLRAAWANKLVYIYSHEKHAYWRSNGAGYTVRMTDNLGIYNFEDAYSRTYHISPQWTIEFEEIK